MTPSIPAWWFDFMRMSHILHMLHTIGNRHEEVRINTGQVCAQTQGVLRPTGDLSIRPVHRHKSQEDSNGRPDGWEGRLGALA